MRHYFGFVQLLDLPKNPTLGWKSWRRESLWKHSLWCFLLVWRRRYKDNLSFCILGQFLALKRGSRSTASKKCKVKFGKIQIVREKEKKNPNKPSGCWQPLDLFVSTANRFFFFFFFLSPKSTRLKSGKGNSCYFFLTKESPLKSHSSATSGTKEAVLCLAPAREVSWDF